MFVFCIWAVSMCKKSVCNTQHLKNATPETKRACEDVLQYVSICAISSWFLIALSVVRLAQPLDCFSLIDGHLHASRYGTATFMQKGGMLPLVVWQRFHQSNGGWW